MHKKDMRRIIITLAIVITLSAIVFAVPKLHDVVWWQRYDAMQEYVKKEIAGDVYVIYSAFPENSIGLPINDLEDVAYEGRIRFIEKHDPFWGKGKDFKSRILLNPTWLDLSIIANEKIKVTGDKHHRYLENFEVLEENGDVAVGKLWLGS